MSEGDKAGQARKGLVDSVKGKAKEVLGAVTGNDSLTAEGQLEQTQAHERREANTVEAVADAEATKARTELREAKVDGAQQRIAADVRAAQAESAVDAQKAAHQHAAGRAAQQDAVKQMTAAEVDRQRDEQLAKNEEREELREAAEDVKDAAAAHQSSVQAASNEKLEADRLRRHADDLTNDTDLP